MKPADRVPIECRTVRESEALKDFIEWDEATLQLLATPAGTRFFHGTLRISGQDYTIQVSLPSEWPFHAPVITFPSLRPEVKALFRIDAAGQLHTGPGDWTAFFTLEKWLLMIIVDVLYYG